MWSIWCFLTEVANHFDYQPVLPFFAPGFQQKAWILGVVEESCSTGASDFCAWARKHRFLVSLDVLKTQQDWSPNKGVKTDQWYLFEGWYPSTLHSRSVDLSSSCSVSTRFDRSISISKISLLLGCVASVAWRGAAKTIWRNAAWYSLMDLSRSWWKLTALRCPGENGCQLDNIRPCPSRHVFNVSFLQKSWRMKST